MPDGEVYVGSDDRGTEPSRVFLSAHSVSLTRSEVIALRDALTEWIGDPAGVIQLQERFGREPRMELRMSKAGGPELAKLLTPDEAHRLSEELYHFARRCRVASFGPAPSEDAQSYLRRKK